MATRINNIDQFLRDLFQNFRVKPSSGSWNKIANALDNTNPKDALIPDVDEVGTLFRGFKVTPSERVWQNIYKILDKDKYTLRRLSRSTVSAIVAFFSNTTATVITSIVVVGGVSLIVLNPFKDDTTKIATIKSTEQLKVVEQKASPAINNQHQIPAQNQTANIQEQEHQSVNNAVADQSQITDQNLNIKTNTHIAVADNNKAPVVVPTVVQQQIIISANTENQNTVLSNNITNTSITNPSILATHSKPARNDYQLSRSPSIKIGIDQHKSGFEKNTVSKVDLQKNMDELIDRFYRQWAKKFNRNIDRFYVEAYYLAMYGSTTFIAHQENSDTIQRSYNEYLSGNPSSSIGLNFGYNPNKIAVEIGVIYEDRHTRRNDDLTWISYETDSVGFIFNTADSTYKIIYDTVQKENLKQYRSRMSYQTLEFPLLVGYKLIDKRSTVIIRTGILTSFIFKSAEEDSDIDETAQQYIVYPERNKVDFAYVLNLSYDFNITNSLKISLTPTFRYNITGMYKGYSINSGAATYGVGLGVKYIF